MPRIVLVTFNARYHHAAFGLRYLKANLGELESTCEIVEFDLEKKPADAVEQVLALGPEIVGLGVYVWNAKLSLEFARVLKAVAPNVKLVIGGPEVSYELEQQEITRLADHVICGEADTAFAALCRRLVMCETSPQQTSVPPAKLEEVALPYRLYSDEDIAHRTIYVESSRGCPFSCEFCLSSLDIPVRRFNLETFLLEMQALIDRGARQFKFVDRTFNIEIRHAAAILEFFLARMREGMFLHFELIPDRLPDRVAELLARFPAGSLQLEIGVQTFDEEVARRIGRRQDNAKVEKNLRYLRDQTHAHIHADLIAGLPGETLEQFAAGFDRLLALRPHEIQLGILKRLRGAPIARHTQAYGMVYSAEPPYDILKNNLVDFETMQRLKRMARLWDIYANSGNFRETLERTLSGKSAFAAFMALSDFVFAQTGRTHQLSLSRQFELLFEYLGKTEDAGVSLARDFLRPGRRDVPGFLQPYERGARQAAAKPSSSGARQARHLA